MKKILLLLLFLSSQLLQAQFAPYRNISPRLSLPSWIVGGDINGDGFNDVLVTTFGTAEVGWYENINQTGEFSQQRLIPISVGLRMAELADIDGDGDLDVIGISRSDDAVVWMENLDGAGNFSADHLISDQISSGESVYAADLDGDGDLDVLSASKSDNKIAWYENTNGIGDFGGQQIISNSANGTLHAVAADFDNDNDLDIIATHSIDDLVVVYENLDGLGNFGTAETISSMVDNPNLVFAKDFDGDNDIDILVDGKGDDNIYHFKNENGTLAAPDILNTNSTSSDVYMNIGDIDGDGDLDVIGVLDGWNHELFWFTLQANGNFSSKKIIEDDEIAQPRYPIILDIHGDGRGEPIYAGKSGFANGSNHISWYPNPSDLGLNYSNDQILTSAINTSRNQRLADMDGDGDLDVVAVSHFSHLVLWYENRDALFDFGAPHVIFEEQVSGHQAFNLADLDNDGDIDIVLSTNFVPQHKVHWLQNDGTGEFSAPTNNTISLSNYFTSAIEIADFNNDGFKDIIVATPQDNEVQLKLNDGNGHFFLTHVIINDLFVTTLSIADMDGDNDIDLIIGGANDDFIQVIDNINGYTQWNNIATFTLGGVEDIETGDLDNDGDLEIIACNGSKLIWYENIDDSSDFGTEQIVSTTSPFSIEVGDMDQDGYNDIVAGEDSFYGLGWFRNLNGTGGFEDIDLQIFYNSQGSYIDIGDLDLDGDLDICYLKDNSSDLGWIPSLLGEPFQIAGDLFFDENENGIKDVDEINLKNRKLTLAPLNLTTWSDDEGKYSFPIKILEYDLTCVSKEDWKFTTDSTYQVLIDGTADTVFYDFGMTFTNPIKEANIEINSGATRCGFDVPFYIDIVNIGNLRVSGNYFIELDTLVTLVSTSVTPDSMVENRLYFNFQNLFPTSSEGVDLVLLMPNENFDGELITSFGNLELVDDDTGLVYFTDSTTYQSEITCAIDPNDKLVTPNIPNYANFTLFGETLEYTIRFQNTGSDTAINIQITDMIDPNLDLATFEVITSSHPYQVILNDEGMVIFDFPNIYLPDSSANHAASMGFIKYKIETLPNLIEYTHIENFANIYFDFNEAIVTNTVTNLMVSEYPFILDTQSPLCFDGADGYISIDFPLTDLSYDWNNNFNGKILEGILAGEYTVTVTNSAGQIVGDTTIILDQPTLIETTVSSTNEMDDNQNGTATVDVVGGTPPYSYVWDVTPAQYTPTAVNLSMGEYEVMVSDVNGCIQLATIVVEQTVGIDQLKNEHQIKISPNPFKELFIVSYQEENKLEEKELNIFDLNGKLILTRMIQSEIEINFKNQSAGIYFLAVKSSEGVFIEKIVKGN